MKKRTKTVLWIVALVILLFLIVNILYPLYILMRVSYNMQWHYNVEFDAYAYDFELVKDFVASEFPNERDKCLIVSHYAPDGIGLYDFDEKKYLTLPQNIQESLLRIDKEAFAYKHSDFATIRIEEDKIMFMIENGPYALIYSPSTKPSQGIYPDENITAKVKSIGDGWYHVMPDQGGVIEILQAFWRLRIQNA